MKGSSRPLAYCARQMPGDDILLWNRTLAMYSRTAQTKITYTQQFVVCLNRKLRGSLHARVFSSWHTIVSLNKQLARSLSPRFRVLKNVFLRAYVRYRLRQTYVTNPCVFTTSIHPSDHPSIHPCSHPIECSYCVRTEPHTTRYAICVPDKTLCNRKCNYYRQKERRLDGKVEVSARTHWAHLVYKQFSPYSCNAQAFTCSNNTFQIGEVERCTILMFKRTPDLW